MDSHNIREGMPFTMNSAYETQDARKFMTTKPVLRSIRAYHSDNRWLSAWLPGYEIKRRNPVYDYEHTRLNLPDDLRNESLKWIAQAALLPMVTWLLFIIPAIALRSSMPAVVDLVGQIVIFFILLGLANTLSLDLIAAVAGLDSIKQDVQKGRWGLLRLSPLGMRRIVKAKHAIAQLSIWRSTCFMIGFRGALLGIIPMHMLVLQSQFGEFSLSSVINLDFPTIQNSATLAIVASFAYCMVGITWILEPLWRVRALTAASLIAAGTTKEPSVRGLVAMRYVLIFEVQTLMGFALAVGLLYLGIVGKIALALILATFMPVLVYNACIRNHRRWLAEAETRLANFET